MRFWPPGNSLPIKNHGKILAAVPVRFWLPGKTISRRDPVENLAGILTGSCQDPGAIFTRAFNGKPSVDQQRMSPFNLHFTFLSFSNNIFHTTHQFPGK